MAQCSVRDIFHHEEVAETTSDHKNVVDGSEITIYMRVVRVNRRNVVHDEFIAVEFRRERGCCQCPYTVLALCHVNQS